ncbi:Centractin [Elasticomyces elasticus]|nr:Centractin [Elasticomyces elasticus]
MADTGNLHNVPIIIDNGSGTIRAGFAGADHPQTFFPSYVGRPKHVRVLAGAVEGDTFIGKKAQELRGLLKINYPLEHGIVTDWDDMERIWQHVFENELKAISEDHPILLTEAPLNDRKNREIAAEVLFEKFQTPALYMSIQAVLSLYASGRTTGVVLDVGDGVSHAVPVYEGFAIPSAIRRVDIAGRDVTEDLQLQLRKAGHVLHTSAEKEIVRDMKEKSCFVAIDPRQMEKKVESGQWRMEKNDVEYTLPDNHKIHLGPEQFRAPEIMFNPELIGKEFEGIHQMVVTGITRTDLDLRKTLYANILLSGGGTLVKGFGERLLTELRRLAPHGTHVKIYAPPERKYSTWIGGSILAGLSTFRKMWISQNDWIENSDLLNTKFM